MKHVLTSENFSLQIDIQIFEADISCPSNTRMKVEIESFEFHGIGEFDIDIKAFAGFSANLQKMYDSLNGHAKIEEPYGVHQYIEFLGDGKGHILVKGFVSQRADNCNHELKFSNKIDQTQLGDFAKELCEGYLKYARS